MKNILIPTVLHRDTLVAVKTAIARSAGNPLTIILLQLQNLPDTFSAAAALRSMTTELSASQVDVLELSRHIVETESNCRIKIQTQYSISSPLLNNLIESLSVDLIILNDSFKNSDTSVNRYCVKLLRNCRQPILHVAEGNENPDFSNALYLENDHSKLQVEDLQQLINESFSCKIVSRAKVFEDQNSDELMPLLSETIYKNNIDLLVETRKPQRIKIGKTDEKSFSKSTGLPVLSLYEKVM